MVLIWVDTEREFSCTHRPLGRRTRLIRSIKRIAEDVGKTELVWNIEKLVTIAIYAHMWLSRRNAERDRIIIKQNEPT